MSALDDALELVRGTGRWERDTAFEPTLLPLVAAHVPPGDADFAVYVARLIARGHPAFGFPLLGIAAARQLAPLIEVTERAIDELPDLLLFVERDDAERLVAGTDDPRFLIRLAARSDRLRDVGDLPDPSAVLELYNDAAAIALLLEVMDTDQRNDAVPALVERLADVDPETRMVGLALIAPYAQDFQGLARQSLDLLATESWAPPWYWTALAAHLGIYARVETAVTPRDRVPEPWAAHFESLLSKHSAIGVDDLAAASHPFGAELRYLVGQLDRDDLAMVAGAVLQGVLERWGGAAMAGPLDDEEVGDEGDEGLGDEGDSATPPDEARSLRVDVSVLGWQGKDVAVAKSLVAGHRHRVKVWIGHQRDASSTTISSPSAIDEDAVVADGGFTELDVTVAHGRRSETRKLYLPTDRTVSSEPVPFDLTVGADERIVSATVAVSQQGRIIQQSVLLGVAGAAPDAVADGKIDLQTQMLARSHENQPAAEGFDATVVRPVGDAPHVLIEGGAATVVAPWKEGLRATNNKIAERLFNTARALVVDPADPSWLDLLRLLAAQGTVLRSWLQNNGYGALAGAERIQLTDADPTEVLALELVYDRGGVTDDATPCAGWAAALETGTCAACGSAAEPGPGLGRSAHICPLGFWGLAKVIERQTGTADTQSPGTADPTAGVLFAASGQVRDADYDATRQVIEDVAGARPAEVTTWDDWVESTRTGHPSLIVVLPHQDYDANLEVDFLEIGPSSRLRAGEVTAALVKPDPGGPAPIVLLLGCKTANASISYQSFAAEFRSNGAAIVVGTLSTVLGQSAAPIAQQFVREIAGAATSQGSAHDFGVVMRTVRRRMVAAGNVTALGLVAFGDTEWTIATGG